MTDNKYGFKKPLLNISIPEEAYAMFKDTACKFWGHVDECGGSCGNSSCIKLNIVVSHTKKCLDKTCLMCLQMKGFHRYISDPETAISHTESDSPNYALLRCFVCEWIIEMSLPNEAGKRIIFQNMIMEARLAALKEGTVKGFPEIDKILAIVVVKLNDSF